MIHEIKGINCASCSRYRLEICPVINVDGWNIKENFCNVFEPENKESAISFQDYELRVRDSGVAWAISELLRQGEIQSAETLLKLWGLKEKDMEDIEPFDKDVLVPFIKEVLETVTRKRT